MRKAEEDLLSGKEVIVRHGQYYCTCGMIHDPQDQQQQLVIKSQEKTGPRIEKDPNASAFFESIPSNTGLTRTRKENFDPEPNEREQLEAEGCTVLEERITDSSGRTIIKR